MYNKQCLTILLFLLFCKITIFSQEKTVFDFNVETSAGVKSGKIEELVFENSKQISKLVWKQSLIPVVGIDLSFEFFSLKLRNSLITAIPVKTGFLEDFDYLSETDDVISYYSKHDNYLDKDFTISSTLIYSIQVVNNKYTLNPFLGVSYQNRKNTAQDGFLQYPDTGILEWTGNEEKKEVAGPVISYEQSIFYPYLGLENTLLFSNLISVLSISYYPYMNINSRDSHVLRLVQFYDSMQGGYGYRIGFSFFSNLLRNNYFDIKMEAFYHYFCCYGSTASNGIGLYDREFILTENAGSGTTSSFFVITLGIVPKSRFGINK